MNTLNRFRLIKLTLEMQKELALPEFICAAPDGSLFPEGQWFYQWITTDRVCEATTAANYLNALFPFLTYLWHRSPALRYTAPAEQIRQGIRDYLKEKLACVVRPQPSGNFTVQQSKAITGTSARLFLTAARQFYGCACLKGWYAGSNPLDWSLGLAVARDVKPHMPAKSGMVLPEDKHGRVPATYFCVVAEQWRPQVIDDPRLRQQLLPAFQRERDQVIVRILFDSGARISEVLSLTFGDWRCKGAQTKAWAPDKGSHHERVKEIWWSSDTAQALRHYIQYERSHYAATAPAGAGPPDSAPLFITEAGQPYTYKAFYANWRKACGLAQLKITPHQIRHWFVTMALRLIDASEGPPSQQTRYRQALIAYMGWHQSDTLQAYDHYLRQLDFTATHEALAQLGTIGPGPTTNRESGVTSLSQLPKGLPTELKQLLSRAMRTPLTDGPES